MVGALAAAFLLPAPSELRSSHSGCELRRFQRWKLARGILSRSFPASPPLHFLSGLLWVRPRGAPQDPEALTTKITVVYKCALASKYVKGEYKNRFNCSVMPVHFTEYNYIPPCFPCRSRSFWKVWAALIFWESPQNFLAARAFLGRYTFSKIRKRSEKNARVQGASPWVWSFKNIVAILWTLIAKYFCPILVLYVNLFDVQNRYWVQLTIVYVHEKSCKQTMSEL